ncbi:MAG TPA: tetratricopeptide repeat protein, partial [Acidimicrobiales bacterium]|nr:tetratricopeptide repeat protein [Acidimicrobiales bacterium]
IALEVKRWGLSYSIFEDNPDKVAAAARALRRREAVRSLPARQQSSQGIYDELVKTSRELYKAGKLDEAERTALRARAMPVYPAVNADRAEDVLHDIEMARANNRPSAQPTIAPPAPTAGPALAVAPAPADHPAGVPLATSAGQPLSDPAVQKSGATVTEGGPDLAAPADHTGAGAPAAGPGPAPAQPAPAALTELPPPAAAAPAQPAPGNRGEQLLAEAKALYASGNFRAAREMAGQAKAGKFGVDAQADELIAQIGMAEQGGALALYEEALTAVRKGDASKARALLIEVAAAGDSLDEGLRAKVQGLLEKLSSNAGAKPGADGSRPGIASTVTAQDAETLAAQKLNAEVGTKIAEARRFHDVDPDKALAIYQQTIQAVQGAGLPPELTRPMVRRLEVAIELAKKDKAIYLVKMTKKKEREEIERKRLRILESDGAKKAQVKAFMEKGMAYYAEGKYVEAETYAKKAMEVDPNELAAPMLAFKARMERRYKTEIKNKESIEEGFVASLQQVDKAAIPADDLLNERSI